MSDVKFLPVKPSSRLQGFYRLSPAERRARLIESRWLAPEDAEGLLTPGLDEAGADAMVENVIGLHTLPLAAATGFKVKGEDRFVPMAVEEPSIVAACSLAARLVAEGAGFTVEADPPLIELVARRLSRELTYRPERATEVLNELRATRGA